jgi:ABC-2 type transport system ATP-binding protein
MQAGRNDILRDAGYLVEVPYSYPELTVRQNLEIIARLRFIKGSNAVDSIIEKLHLSEYSDRKAKNLSLGNAQRLGLAKALIHNPRLLILDEPANGLDPAGIVEVRELLKELASKEGVTVFISSHILSEISRLTTRIGIIHQGSLIKELDAAQLERLSEKRLIIGTADISSVAGILSRNGYSKVEYLQGKLAISDDKAIEHPEAIAKLMCDSGHPPGMLVVSEEDLESYFLRTIGVKTDGI